MSHLNSLVLILRVFNLLFVGLFFTFSLQANTQIVTNTGNDGSGSLRAQVHNAVSGDTILFADSLNGDTVLLSGTQIQLDKNLVIVGNSSDSTIIDGAGNARIFEVTDTVQIHTMTLQNGDSGSDNGGGILNNSMFTITKCTISGNIAEVGGGISNDGTLTVVFSTIHGNDADSEGAGIYNADSLSLMHSTIYSNTVSNDGGAIYNNTGSNLGITNSTISNNIATDGGGIFNNGELGIQNSTISGNGAFVGGGVFNDGTLTVTNNTITENIAVDAGGGIYNDIGVLTVLNSTITENAVIDNVISGNGGGIFNEDSLSINNTIIAENTVPNIGPDGFNSTGGTIDGSSSYNLIGDTSNFDFPTGNNNILGNTTNPVDPLLEPLADNGGPTKTHALLCTSSAYNAGDPTLDTPDQRGESVFADTIDIGAYESQSDLINFSNTTHVVTTTQDAGMGSLRQTVLVACPGDTIVFDPNIDRDTVVLTSGQILLDKELVLLGNGPSNTIVDGDDSSRIFTITDTVKIHDLTLQNGNVTSGNGGAIFNESQLIVSNVRISSNTATNNGGAIYNNTGANLGITNSTISNNEANEGGAIDNFGALTVSTSMVSKNESDDGGGIYNRQHLVLTNTTIDSNSSNPDNGGGLWNNGIAKIQSSTFSGNEAEGSGAGIYNADSLSLVNSTISDNDAGDEGGGISNNSTQLILHNTIVAANTAVVGPDGFNEFGASINGSSSYNIIGDNSDFNVPSGNNNMIGVYPLLGPLADNGGPTETHALQCGSPAYNAGDPTLDTPDQRGESVFADIIDIGAFEAQMNLMMFIKDVHLVTNTQDTGVGSLRRAVFNACPGDTIVFDPDIDGDTISLTSSQILLKKELVLIGNGPSNTIVGGDHSSRIFKVIDTVELHLMTIKNGSVEFESGGGILNIGKLLISDIVFNNNKSVREGGAIGNIGILSAVNSTFSGNTSENEGGGIFNQDSLYIENSTFRNNTAIRGGGISNKGGDLEIHSGAISGNTSDINGGGIYLDGGDVKLHFSTISDNTAISGGGIAVLDDNVEIQTSTISDNTAEIFGGGIFIFEGDVGLQSSTISGNGAFVGGGISNSNGNLGIKSSTISGNTSENEGGGIRNDAQLTMHNTIVAGNTAQDGKDGYNDGGTIDASSSYNLIGDNSNFGVPSGNNNLIGANPRLDALADNGGPTETHALLCNSPAYNAGDPTLDTPDQRGEPVFSDTIDIGAYELQRRLDGSVKLTVTNTSNDGYGSLRYYIDLACSGDTIVFADPLNGHPIVLNGAQIALDKELVLIGNGRDTTIIDGDNNGRVFEVTGTVELIGLTIQNGSSEEGGGIFNEDSLYIENSMIGNNSAMEGGGIYNNGALEINGSGISENEAELGSGIMSNKGNLIIHGSTISDNDEAFWGGGIFFDKGALEIHIQHDQRKFC